MQMKLLLEKASDITITAYTEDDVWDALEDVIMSYQELEDEFKEFKEHLEDNYRPLTIKEQIDYNERDFY